MRNVLASKWYLGVTVCAAACGGCQEQQGSTAAPPPALTVPSPAVAVASATPPPMMDVPADVSQTDVIGWTVRGVTDDVILDRIEHARTTFHLSAADEMRLRDAGVSDDVVRAMKATAWN